MLEYLSKIVYFKRGHGVNYINLIQRAFKTTWRHKFLWFLGILASFTSSGVSIFNSDISEILDIFKEHQPKIEPSNFQLPQVLGASAFDWISAHLYLLLGVALLFLLIFLCLFVVSIMASGGLIASVSKIEHQEQVSFKTGFSEGYHAFWRLFGISIIISLLILFTFAILSVPVILLILAKNFWVAGALVLFFFSILFIISIYLGILFMYAIRFTLLEKTGVISSIKNAHDLIVRFKKEVLFVWLISFGMGIAFGLVLTILIGVAIPPIFGLGITIYFTSGLWGALIYSLVWGLIILFGLLLIAGIYTAFQSSFWTFAYLDLTKSRI